MLTNLFKIEKKEGSMAGQEEKIRNYLKTYLKKGYSKEELRKVLIEFHYNPKIIDSVFKEIKRPELKPKERIEKPAIIKPHHLNRISYVFLAIVVIAVIAVLFASSKPQGCSRDCFIKKADNCENAVLREKLANTTTIIKYKAENCNLIKTIESFDKAEPEEIISLFKGKEMSCSYEKNDFNEEIINGLVGGIEDCSGDLKDAIYELRIAQYGMES